MGVVLSDGLSTVEQLRYRMHCDGSTIWLRLCLRLAVAVERADLWLLPWEMRLRRLGRWLRNHFEPEPLDPKSLFARLDAWSQAQSKRAWEKELPWRLYLRHGQRYLSLAQPQSATLRIYEACWKNIRHIALYDNFVEVMWFTFSTTSRVMGLWFLLATLVFHLVPGADPWRETMLPAWLLVMLPAGWDAYRRMDIRRKQWLVHLAQLLDSADGPYYRDLFDELPELLQDPLLRNWQSLMKDPTDHR